MLRMVRHDRSGSALLRVAGQGGTYVPRRVASAGLPAHRRGVEGPLWVLLRMNSFAI